MSQLAFRVGGPYTVRGYEYGTRTGSEFWSAQLDFALTRSPFWAPVVFFDVGDTFRADPLMGVGAGLSLVNGMMRFNLSKGLRPSTGIRFDLAFSAAR
jgi:hemolysin activation/secretion protein